MQLKFSNSKHIFWIGPIGIDICTNAAQLATVNFQISEVSMIFQNGPFIPTS